MDRDEGLRWSLLNGEIFINNINPAIILFSYDTPPTSESAIVAMRITLRMRTQNSKKAFRHSTQPYRNSSRPKDSAIVDAGRQYVKFHYSNYNHPSFSFVVNVNQVIYYTSTILMNLEPELCVKPTKQSFPSPVVRPRSSICIK